ncbi:unnamed protein product [Phytophthora fragariaefolia]|uniref:Unnamed protein product n=1 Tax=Phytophthora fragariaefolia TaxID=1490495 RepID=A0A9W7D798_9STRA|nr:unnamed protein product [Phytophthora fragariaefolia]
MYPLVHVALMWRLLECVAPLHSSSEDSWENGELLAQRSEDAESAEGTQPAEQDGDAASHLTTARVQQNEGALHCASEGHVHASAKRRKRFGPNEDYILAVQVNKDTPFAANYGWIRKAWQSLADKLNASPNFRMEVIKGTTAQARFEALMIKHRAFEAKSARDSGTDERETRLVQVLTDVAAKGNNHNTAKAKVAADAAGAEQAKAQAGDVVRDPAVSGLQRGKRRATERGEASDDEETSSNRQMKTSPKAAAAWSTAISIMRG